MAAEGTAPNQSCNELVRLLLKVFCAAGIEQPEAGACSLLEPGRRWRGSNLLEANTTWTLHPAWPHQPHQAGAQRDVATDVRSLLTQKFEQELQGLVELAHRVQSSLGKLDGLAADYDAQIGAGIQPAGMHACVLLAWRPDPRAPLLTCGQAGRSRRRGRGPPAWRAC